MTIKTYYSVNITADGYQLLTTPEKIKGLDALATLKNIEKIIKYQLQYIAAVKDDPFILFSEQEKKQYLKHIANEIQAEYLKNSKTLSNASAVKTTIQAIENRISPPPLFPLTTEAIFQIIQLTGWTMIGQLNRTGTVIARQFVVLAAQKLSGKQKMTIANARQFFQNLKPQFFEAQQKGFLPKELETWINLEHHLKLENEQRENLFEVMPKPNFPTIHKIGSQRFPKATVKQCRLTDYGLWHVFDALDDKKTLVICCKVSHKWKNFAEANALWLKFYLEYFSKPSSELTYPSGYWKGKLCVYLNNMFRGIYVEQIVSHNALQSSAKIINNFFLLRYHNPDYYELWSIDKGGKFELPQAIYKSHHTCLLVNNKFLAKCHKDKIYLEDLTQRAATYEIALPSRPNHLDSSGDTIFFTMEDGTRYTLWCPEDKQQFSISQLVLPHAQASSRASWKEWMVATSADRKIIYLLKLDQNEVYKLHQTIDIEATHYDKFMLYQTSDGTPFMVQEAVYEYTYTTTLWKYDAKDKIWKECQCLDNTCYLSGTNKYIYTAQFFQMAEKPDFHKHTGIFEAWKVTPEGWIKTGSLDFPICIHTSGEPTPILGMYNLWKNKFAGLSCTAHFLYLALDNGDLFILDSHNLSLKRGSVRKGDYRDLQATRDDFVIKNNHIYKMIVPGWYNLFPRMNRHIAYLGCLQKNLLALEGGVLKLRRFDTTEPEVLEDLAKRFEERPSTRVFRAEYEIGIITELYHRFKCLHKTIKRGVYATLGNVLFASNSINSFLFKNNPQLPEGYARAKKAFYNGAFKKFAPDEPRWHYYSEPSDIAQALSIFSQQLALGMETVGIFMMPNQWSLVKDFIEVIESSKETRDLNIKSKKYSLTAPFDRSYTLRECQIFRLYLQQGDTINAQYWLKRALYTPEDIDYYLNGFRSNIKELGLIYRSLIERTNSKTQASLNRIYNCYTQAASLLEKIESFVHQTVSETKTAQHNKAGSDH